MMIFILAFLVFFGLVLLMAIGVLFKRAPLKGSCGGLGQIGLREACDICGGAKPLSEEQQQQARDQSYSA